MRRVEDFARRAFDKLPPAWFKGCFLSVLYLSAASTVDGTRSEGVDFLADAEIGWLEHTSEVSQDGASLQYCNVITINWKRRIGNKQREEKF